MNRDQSVNHTIIGPGASAKYMCCHCEPRHRITCTRHSVIGMITP
jgi:hypothetical protein